MSFLSKAYELFSKLGQRPVNGNELLEKMHGLFLEALRHREEAVVQYISILAPAMGGFVYLYVKGVDARVFSIGSIGVILLLLMGAIYSLVLGYNFRYIVFQIAKIEAFLGVKDVMLVGWPRSPVEFEKYCCRCTPPEIIKVFWRSFMVGIAFVAGLILFDRTPAPLSSFQKWSIVGTGTLSLIVSWAYPFCLGKKFQEKWNVEMKDVKAKEVWKGGSI